jgi:hypothetical protein
MDNKQARAVCLFFMRSINIFANFLIEMSIDSLSHTHTHTRHVERESRSASFIRTIINFYALPIKYEESSAVTSLLAFSL